jgi:4-diphosphocytidyl-2-C-methyl-D-erythritol kinase
MQINAYAKINLVLAVGGRRPDGYHEVETILQQLELHDRLEFREADGFSLYTDSREIPSGPENLVWRAASLLRTRYCGSRGAEIRLYKSIPVTAGLAGGSADAAAALKGLNRLWGLELDFETLQGLAAELGADVPFCLAGPTALARGRGELVTSLSPAPTLGVVVVKPPFGVRAAEAYAWFDRIRMPFSFFVGAAGGGTGVCHDVDVLAMLHALEARDGHAIARSVSNDLEAVVFDRHPELSEIKRQLLDGGALGALMAGSGPVVFGLTADLAGAEAVAAGLRSRGWPALATRFRDGGPEAFNHSTV